ncbi:unnamed protein product [Pleuronectes platessa]|uniref:Uncharacterized protein n=1 Tax=Pleuronectes platessa TaxID=8262 RepID=A0A9N7TJC9_PLEPL|nr:unnamed protein product [Pleuronectes platessa]
MGLCSDRVSTPTHKMASSFSLLSEDQLLCPICLDTFTQPVSTPCGHNFCLSCLSSYWDNERVCQCPVCKETFARRPDLKHMNHDVVPVQQAYGEMRDLLGDTEARVQQMIQERKQKLEAIKESVKESKRETSEQELTELQRTKMRLMDIKQTEDQLCFLQTFPESILLPTITDLSSFSFNRHIELWHVQKCLSSSVSQLRTLLKKMTTATTMLAAFHDVTLRNLQQYEVNVLLDPDTAHPLLVLSYDGKQVRFDGGSGRLNVLDLRPSTFSTHLAVLGRRGFWSQRFYFEVLVSQKTEWCLGVATASIQRKWDLIRGPDSGLWAIWFLEDRFETFSSPGVTVYPLKVERVGVFVDYDKGQISFYDVQTATLIHSISDCLFTEELYPYFNPCDNEYGSNLDPMVIVPVTRTDASLTPQFVG